MTTLVWLLLIAGCALVAFGLSRFTQHFGNRQCPQESTCKDLMKNAAPIPFAIMTTAGFFYCIYRMLAFGFPNENKDFLNTLLGVLGTIWTLQMNFFYGGSASGKQKDETLSAIA